jgi:hypothetical protein
MELIDKALIDPDVEPTGDKVHRVAKAAISSIPVIGGAAVEAFQALIEPPIERRRTQWMLQVTEAINLLSSQGMDIEQLFSNEQFFSTFIQASAVAIKTHQEEKRAALRNAIINSALSPTMEDFYQHVFIQMIDRYTVWHIKALKLFSNPSQWEIDNHPIPDEAKHEMSTLLRSAYPELEGLHDTIVNDLQIRDSLLVIPDFTDTFKRAVAGDKSKTSIFCEQTTHLGDQLLWFIEDHPGLRG